MSPRPDISFDDEGALVVISLPEWSTEARTAAMQLALVTLRDCGDVLHPDANNPITVEMGTTNETLVQLDIAPEHREHVMAMLKLNAERDCITIRLTPQDHAALDEHVAELNTDFASDAGTRWCAADGCNWTSKSRVPRRCPSCGGTDLRVLPFHTPFTRATYVEDLVREELARRGKV